MSYPLVVRRFLYICNASPTYPNQWGKLGRFPILLKKPCCNWVSLFFLINSPSTYWSISMQNMKKSILQITQTTNQKLKGVHRSPLGLIYLTAFTQLWWCGMLPRLDSQMMPSLYFIWLRDFMVQTTTQLIQQSRSSSEVTLVWH